MGWLDGIDKALNIAKRVVDTTEKIGQAIPDAKKGVARFKRGVDELVGAVQEVRAAAAPVARAIAPYPADVLSAAGLLGLKLPFTEAELKEAHKAAALRVHPDHDGDNTTMANINGARNTLKGWCSG